MWTEISIIRFRSQNFSNLIVNRVNLNDLVPLSCLIYNTTVALSHIKRTTLLCRWFRNALTAHKTALSLRVLMWFWLCAGDHWLLMLRSPNWAPHPRREASVYRVTSISGLLSDKPWQTAGDATRQVGVWPNLGRRSVDPNPLWTGPRLWGPTTELVGSATGHETNGAMYWMIPNILCTSRAETEVAQHPMVKNSLFF